MSNILEEIIPVWGTEIYIQVASKKLNQARMREAIGKVKEFFLEVDANFSTYKVDSAVTKLRTNKLAINDAPVMVQEVWEKCINARHLTNGAFDPWSVAGGFDPSGFVKGWAAEKAAEILVLAGCESIQVNAAGDIALRGGAPDGSLWKIGVVNPDNRSEIVQVFEIYDGNIATSGTYEKGAHIHDPHTGLIAIGAKSGTVIGPDGGLCDAFATALMVDGTDAAEWIGNPELSDFTYWAINRNEDTAWSFSSNIGV